LKFQDTKILDNILSCQRSPSIKYGIDIHETVKGESSSQACSSNYEVNKENFERNGKEITSQPDQHPMKMDFQRKSCAPNIRNIN